MWHRWFAWRPVWLTSGRLVWWKWIERKYQVAGSVFGDSINRFYRELDNSGDETWSQEFREFVDHPFADCYKRKD